MENKNLTHQPGGENLEENLKPNEDILKPDANNKDIDKPKKKSHKLLWTLIIFLIILVILPLFFLGYTGLFHIPVLTSIFGSDKPINLGVEISDAAIESGMAKTPWISIEDLPEPPATSPLDVNRVYTGSVPVSNDITSEEFSSFVNQRFEKVDTLESIQIKFYEGGAEASFQLNRDMLDMPIYIKSGITKGEGNTLNFDIQKIKVGKMPIPSTYLVDIEKAATDFVNDRMAKIVGFSIEKIEFKDNFVDFKGTYPETITLIE